MERQRVAKTQKTVSGNTAVRRQSAGPRPGGHPIATLQRSIGNHAIQRLIGSHYIQAKLRVNEPGDEFEKEADRTAESVMRSAASGSSLNTAPSISRVTSGAGAHSGFKADSKLEAQLNNSGSGRPLPGDVRAFMEPQLGADLSHVRVHTGSDANEMNKGLNAVAFTHGSNVYFGSGKAPGKDALTAHELTHVIQQTGGGRSRSTGGSAGNQVGRKCIQRSLNRSVSVANGGFEVDMQTRLGALASPPTLSGLDGYIRFIPNPTAPNSNQIVMNQIIKYTDQTGADAPLISVPSAQSPRGALGQPGVRTQDDPARGVEGGFLTDVHHRPNLTAPGVPQGTALSPRYNFQPAAPGTTGIVGTTAQPAQYGGGIGGVVGQTPGFKRSNDPADIRSAAIYDTPGNPSRAVSVDFDFETVARGEDTMFVYGVVNWGFGLRAGRVINEHISFQNGQSATFDEAMERHRDFYVHEPVTFYFAFDSDVLSATEAAKIDTFTAYLGRNTDVLMSIDGFADIRGGASAHNLDLSLRRAQAVEAALLGRGIAAGRIHPIVVGSGASSSATMDAGTGDQGGNAALGADQTREANRQFNRRVVLTFEHTATRAPAPTPPAGGAP